MASLVFLKLGGSLITDKSTPYTAPLDKLADLADQIARARQATAGLSLVLGHGSGSFGHAAAQHLAPAAPETGSAGEGDYWRSFAEVWYQASALNRLVMDSLHGAGLAAVAISPAAGVLARDGRVLHWDLAPLRSALAAGLLPVVYGDVVFDEARGGTILSTEDLFAHLARELRPEQILLAGLEPVVWADFPARRVRAERITAATFPDIAQGLGASHGLDVTGGMASKVRQMLALVQEIPGLTVQIFSGDVPGNVERALGGELLGSLISAG